MNYILKSSLALALTVGLFSCDKKENPTPQPPGNGGGSDVVTISQNIAANETWSSSKTYILAGRITVLAGATLTIEPGTVIKGQVGTGANATALLIARGAKLMAEGTADKPIIFTTVGDEITKEDVAAGKFASPNLAPDANGLWGGVLICGKASISASAAEIQIEGIPTSDQNGLYGGSDDADNSGVIKYISIRHGGANIGSGNEINGLTLAGVGSGTVIENVEVVGNQDDGIEWFGGTVSVKNALVWNAGDDAIDADQSWGGTLDNFVVITPGDHVFELDGAEGTMTRTYTIKNGSVVNDYDGRKTGGDLINTDKNTMVNLENIFFKNVVSGQQINRTIDNPGTKYTNIVINGSGSADDYIKDGPAPAGITVAASASGKANTGAFGWTWASKANVLAGL
ncbi:MAG TPA: hypothetical protein VIN07_08330 [Flavipsychrobacter sp.]